ncbi:MAG: ABC transporter permease, partial [Candidatus Acidiferrum sp.]
MKAGDLGELALRNLREAVLRNSLTTLGVAVGVASLVAMLSLGVGLQELATKRLANTGLFDTVIVTQRRNMEGMRRRPTENSTPEKEARQLDESARNELARLPNVVEVYPQIRFPTEVRYGGISYSTIVAGVPASAQQTGAFDGIQGRFFSGPNANEAILQIEFAKDLSP